MSSLSSEQQKRIEEKKKEALERLARKRTTTQSHVECSQAKRLNTETKYKSLSSSTTSDSIKSIKSLSSSITSDSIKPIKSLSSSTTSDSIKPIKSLSSSITSDSIKSIKAVFSLVSESRFNVHVSYDAMLIELFKQVPSRMYDCNTRIWSFGLEHYVKLVDHIQSKLTHIQFSLIPKPVLNLFTKRGVDSIRVVPSDIDTKIPSKLLSALMEFQREGVEYSLARNGRVLIADDMGLGKTIQAIAVSSYYQEEWPVLIVCPASMKISWANAFQRWIPTLSANDINVVMTTKCSLNEGLVNIVSYDLLVKLSKELKELNFKIIIADESHFLKNYKTARATVILPLIKKAKRALLLSGTPALSRPIELYTQITSLDRTFIMKLTQFGKRYCNGVQNKFGWDFSGASNMEELHLYMKEKIMIRRLKSAVLQQLPTKRRQMVVLDLSMKTQWKKDKKIFIKELEKISTIEKPSDKNVALLPLFSKTAELKLPVVKDYIFDMLEGGRKLLIFAHHRIVLNGICEGLVKSKYRYVRIDGSTPSDVRQSYCDIFQHDDKCLVAVLSITAANTGITLTAASTVIFAELFWNPGALVQAEDRVYRIGQKNAVNIHYLVAKETVDDFIWPLVNKKLNVLNKAGLAGEDFSTADSTLFNKQVVDGQLTLDDFFNEQSTSTSGFEEKEQSTSTSGFEEKEQSTSISEFNEEERTERYVEDDWFETLSDADLSLLEGNNEDEGSNDTIIY